VTGLQAGVILVALGAGATVIWGQHQDLVKFRDALTAAHDQVSDLTRQLDGLATENGALAMENADLARHLEDTLSLSEAIQARADAAERDLRDARADASDPPPLEVREVRSSADFPIERAMAKDGDTVAGFAEREGSTEAVVRALNPWLEDTRFLSARQTLWVPKRRP